MHWLLILQFQQRHVLLILTTDKTGAALDTGLDAWHLGLACAGHIPGPADHLLQLPADLDTPTPYVKVVEHALRLGQHLA